MPAPADLPRLLAARDWEAAERVLRRAARRADAPAAVHYNLAKVLEAAERPGRAAALERAVRADPRHRDAWFELGRARQEGDPEGAREAFARAGALGDAEGARMAARLALRLGRWEEALAAPGDDEEARVIRWRAAAELGQAPDPAALPPGAAGLRAMVRVAKGRLPMGRP